MSDNYLYKMGEFHPVESILGDGDFEEELERCGYWRWPQISLGNEQFPFFQLYEKRQDISESKYPFCGNVCFGNLVFEIYFDTWVSVLHFLQNYTSWIGLVLTYEKK